MADLNYPPEIMDAVASAKRAAVALDAEMQDVGLFAATLAGSGNGNAVDAFTLVHQEWNQSGIAHNEELNRVAAVAGQSYDEMTAFDAYVGNALRNV